jgi:hypothetical protein
MATLKSSDVYTLKSQKKSGANTVVPYRDNLSVKTESEID